MSQLQSLSAAEQQSIISTAEIEVSRYANYLMNKNHIPNLFSKEDLEDIAGDTIVKACRSFENYDPKKAKLSTWVCRIAINCVKDALDYRMKRLPISGSPVLTREADGEEYDAAESGMRNPETKGRINEYAADRQLCSKEFERCFWEKVAKLSDRNRKYVSMLDEGYKPKDMAVLDNCSPNAASKRVYDIRQFLRKEISGLASEYEICLNDLAG